ncbi:MAG: hypothetical protein QOJ25_2928 [Solirubrobacteraceae bacterium]|jgi:hypothetical protein|nr:hypothetical protein [Solirubrobacteraceae bacterium]
MRWPRPRKPERVPGEYPESFVKGFMQKTLPFATPAEAASGVRHLRSKGWSEEKLAEFILPYIPRGAPAAPGPAPAAPGPAPPAASVPGTHIAPRLGPRREQAQAGMVPADVTPAWLDEHLPAMDRRQMRLVVDELERRGWPSGTVAMAVLPHLLPKLPTEDAQAIIAGLAEMGMSQEEIARATRSA